MEQERDNPSKPPVSIFLHKPGQADEAVATTKNSKLVDRDCHWIPFHLRRRTLLSFLLVYACIAAAIGVLAAYSKRNDGLSTASNRNHYLWTYGPTAILTLVALFWNQTEYRAKQIQPWMSMRDGFLPASQSLLLDYINQWNALAFVRAIYHKHTLSALGISGSLLLKLLTVLSTALFVLEDVTVHDRDAVLHVTEAFGVGNSLFWAKDESSNQYSSDPRPVAIVLGLAGTSLRLPNGTSTHHAFQQFTQSRQPHGDTISIQAAVDVFESNLVCERASFNGEWKKSLNDSYFHATSVSSRTCTRATVPNYQNDWDFDDSYVSSFGTARCANHSSTDEVNGMRLLFHSGTMDRTAKRPANNTAALLCYPRYNVHTAFVSIDKYGGATISPSTQTSQSRSINGLSPWNLATAFVNSVDAAYSLIGADAPNIRGGHAFGFEGGFLFSLLDQVNPQPSVQDWSNLTLLNATLQNVWSRWSAQNAALHLKIPERKSITGTTTTIEPRLLIHTLPFWSMEATLLALIAVIAILASLNLKCILPRDTASLGGLATIMASSEELQAAFHGKCGASEREFRRSLKGTEFCTELYFPEDEHDLPKFCIKHTIHSDIGQEVEAVPRNDKSWWRSGGSSYWYIAATLVLFTALIGLLEGVYQYAAANNGIVDVASPDGYVRFAWTTVPALAMVAITAIASMQYSGIRIIQPFQHLKQGSASARRGLFKYPFSGSRLSSVAEAFADRELGLIFTSLAAFLSPFLTIVVSGLFITHATTVSTPINIQQVEDFRNHSTVSNDSPLQIELVTLGNLSYPRFTYETFAFPTLKAAGDMNGTINLEIPALQGVLNCSTFPVEDIISINNTWRTNRWTDNVNVVVRDRTGCMSQYSNEGFVGGVCKGGPYGNAVPHDWATYQNWTGFDHPHDLQYPGTQCRVPPSGSVAFNMYGDTTNEEIFPQIKTPVDGYFGYIWGRGHPHKCPSTIGLLGKTTHHRVEMATLFTCNPFVHKVRVNTTFLAPNMDIDPANLPKVIPQTSERVEFQMPEPPPWESNGDPMNSFGEFYLPPTSSNEKLVPFMSVLVYGTGGIPMAELTDPANTDRLYAAIDRLWGVGMAQLINDYRVPLGDQNIIRNAVLTSPGSPRLMQSAISTRILEGLLLAIAVCLAFAFFSTNTRNVVRLNPCTIAGLASLLVDSDLLTKGIIPLGAEWCSDDELLKLFHGWVFSLGWWYDDEKQRRFGVDVGQPLMDSEKFQEEEEMSASFAPFV